MSTNTKRKNVITLPPALACYVALLEPRAMPNSDKPPQFKVALLWKKSDAATMKQLQDLKRLIAEVATAKFGPKAVELLKARKIASPIYDGDVEKPEVPEFKGMVYVNAKAKANRPPQVVDERVQPIFEDTEIYSGCIVRASVAVFPYDKEGKQGVAIALNGVMRVKKGERLDSRMSADDMFGDFKEEGTAGEGEASAGQKVDENIDF